MRKQGSFGFGKNRPSGWVLYCIVLSIFLAMTACDPEESLASDTVPPFKPEMIPNLGDTGDGATAYYINTPDGPVLNTIPAINDQNNGIDAVPDEDWIRIQWAPFFNADLDYMKIYRYLNSPGNIELIDSLRAGETDHYMDQTLNLKPEAVGGNWYYLFRLYDKAGNYSVSDTVGYQLLPKTPLSSPLPNTTVMSGETIVFRWQRVSGANFSRYRILVFNPVGEMMDFFDETDTDPDTDFFTWNYTFPLNSISGTYYWRVDALGEASNITSGSESNMWPLVLVSGRNISLDVSSD